jgi:hypothetical protein
MQKLKSTSDGLIGLWCHTFDDDGDIEWQFQIIRRSHDAYVCRLYSWENGRPADCVVIPRKKILGLRFYESSQGLNVALDKYLLEKNQQQATSHNVVPFPSYDHVS